MIFYLIIIVLALLIIIGTTTYLFVLGITTLSKDMEKNYTKEELEQAEENLMRAAIMNNTHF